MYLHRGATSFALGSDSQAILLSMQGPNGVSVGPRVHDSRQQERCNAHGPVSMMMWGLVSSSDVGLTPSLFWFEWVAETMDLYNYERLTGCLVVRVGVGAGG